MRDRFRWKISCSCSSITYLMLLLRSFIWRLLIIRTHTLPHRKRVLNKERNRLERNEFKALNFFSHSSIRKNYFPYLYKEITSRKDKDEIIIIFYAWKHEIQFRSFFFNVTPTDALVALWNLFLCNEHDKKSS